MNTIFSVPAAVASAIVACRSFISLTNFRQRVYVHPAPPRSSTPVSPGEGSGRKVIQIQARAGGVVASDSSPTRKWGGVGNTIATTLCRGIGAGGKSLGQTHSTDELHTRGMTSSLLAVTESKRGNANSQVLVHVVRDFDVAQSMEYADVVDLEMLELSSDKPGQKSFVPDV